jgi:ribosomal protein S18 acetylase RimI-like enzyme
MSSENTLDKPLSASERELLRLCEESVRPTPSERMIVERFGPFLAAIETTSAAPWLNSAVPIEPEDDAGTLARSIEEVRRFFQTHERALRFEFSERRWPGLPAALERAGLRAEEREPLLFCAPGELRATAAPGVSFHFLTSEDPDDILGAHQMIRFEERLEGEPPYAPAPAIARLREEVGEGKREFVLAYLDGQIAGTGVGMLHANGVGEIVGIVTLPALRRRGVAASVTSLLAERILAHGGQLVWLSAERPEAQRIYERLGFRRSGDWLAFTETTEAEA